ncbi:RICIN domain-containing protein [Catenovulum sp. 2E275]|uniref:LamG-like jellyroll fold domain-containing protein n=1 Tax=Catenovulum sp. 2E275 TaxID=2980497 RepID=UPI0021D0F12B|nr:LamG-like jellyroll fold domain-containing protein [Catenovulum sp. 2E275]MCU4677201.1 RICIN domain-containing protein [Catenovulum sp. 2E275]
MIPFKLSALALALTLAACGGSNTNNDSNDNNNENSVTPPNPNDSTDIIVPAQEAHLIAQGNAERTIAFNTIDTGLDKKIDKWGLDTAWADHNNVIRGTRFMGKEQVDLVRVSFRPTDPLEIDSQGEYQLATTTVLDDLTMYEYATKRIDILNQAGLTNIDVVMNSDHPRIDSWYKNSDGTANVEHWIELFKVTRNFFEENGHQVIGLGPFNEPDYTSTGQGSMQDFLAISTAIKADSYFDDLFVNGGNTLNNDEALSWYNMLKDTLDYGNTHQLAGSFAQYAGFFKQVKSDGRKAMNDELHNIMEAMVGVEYGIDTGIFWGSAEYTRGQFVQASDGKRLGYAEHRPHWTAASVYRAPDGKIQAFASGSERQATTTKYRFTVKDKAVFFDGHGPLYNYTITVPGGNGYWIDQPNYETTVNIEWGDDIRPVIGGRYKIVNKETQQVLEMEGSDNGANFQVSDDRGEDIQLWNVSKRAIDAGGDDVYYSMVNHSTGGSPDIWDWNLDVGGDIRQWSFAGGSNQEWILQYEGNGWFSICSRFSSYCIETAGTNAQQEEHTGEDKQLWRFIPEGVEVELIAPNAPSNLQAIAQSESIALSWDANSEMDIASYTLLRSTNETDGYEIIARNLAETNFVDNTAQPNQIYFYKLRAEDKAFNYSELSSSASAASTGEATLVAQFSFEKNAIDSSENQNHAAVSGELIYGAAIEGDYALKLNGPSQFIQLPAGIANSDNLTVLAWVKWNGGDAEQHIFNFGNDDSENITLTPKSKSGSLQLSINQNGTTQTLESTPIDSGEWIHLALVFDNSKVKLYQDTILVAETSEITLKPSDIKPVANFIGRGQSSAGQYFNGSIDDLRIYNYALTENDVQAVYQP